MHRRNFIANTLKSAAAIAAPLSLQAAAPQRTPSAPPFRMKFSPEFGIFSEVAGKDVVDQIKWGHDQGFRAWENTGLKLRSAQEQERISKTVQQLNMEFGQFVGNLDPDFRIFKDVTFAGTDQSLRDGVLKHIRESVDIARRMNTKFIHVVLGMADPKLPWDYQLANAIDLLKRIADIYQPHGLVMVMETMNHKKDHPGMFLHNIPQAYALAKAVNRPEVKLLFDFYHVQIQEGNLLPNLDHVWDEIGYIQMGDSPGRKEPTSGEINYVNVLQHLHNKGYRGFVGLEHGNSRPGKEGALHTLDAYRKVDPK
jgi:hydroxypyruvate isomerase